MGALCDTVLTRPVSEEGHSSFQRAQSTLPARRPTAAASRRIAGRLVSEVVAGVRRDTRGRGSPEQAAPGAPRSPVVPEGGMGLEMVS